MAALFVGCSADKLDPDSGNAHQYTLQDCQSDATAELDAATEGPYSVGYRKYEIRYTGPSTAGTRKVTVNVWYPTSSATGEGTRYLGLFLDQDVHTNAPPASPQGACGFPLLAYSHGFRGLAGGPSYLMRHMASHGWVTVAPDHTLNTLPDDGDLPDWFHLTRVTDISAAVDSLRDLAASDPLGGKIATDRYVLVGHSYGAMTAWMGGGARFDADKIRERCTAGEITCTQENFDAFAKDPRDPRVTAIVPMAGAFRRSWFGERGFQVVDVPILEMTGTHDTSSDSEVEATWPLMDGLKLTWVRIAGGCHQTFDLGACDKKADIDIEEGYAIVKTYVLAFARHHLLGDSRTDVMNIISGSKSLSSKVTFQKKDAK